MAISRFDKFQPRDYSMDWFVPKEVLPDFQKWDQVLGSLQKTKDEGETLANKNPNYLQTQYDIQEFNNYRQKADAITEEVANAYKELGAMEGNRLMRQKTKELAKEWQPGGRANVLTDRYTSYAKGVEEINKAYEKDPRGINKQYAMEQLRLQLEKPIDYNEATGKYNRISTPELFTDPNMQKLIMDAAKDIKESGSSSIIQTKDPFWFKKVKDEGVPAKQLEMIAKAIYEQYPNQMGIEAWHVKRGLDPKKAEENYSKSLDGQYSKIESQFANVKTMTVEELKSMQDKLKQTGDYKDLEVDGVYGKQTQAAIDDYLKKQKSEIETMKSGFDINTYAQTQVAKNLTNSALAFATNKHDEDLVYNKALEFQMDQARKAREHRDKMGAMEKLISANERLVTPETGKETVTPDRGKALPDFMALKKSTDENEKQASRGMDAFLGSSVGKQIGNIVHADGGEPLKFGWPGLGKQASANDVSELVLIYNSANRDKNAFIQNARRSGTKYSYLSDDAIGKLFDLTVANESSINNAYSGYREAKQAKEMVDANVSSVEIKYAQTKEGKSQLLKIQEIVPKKPGETDEEYIKAMNSDNTRFDIKNEGKDVQKQKTYTIVDGRVGRSYAPHTDPVTYFKSNVQTAVKKNPTWAKSMNTYSIGSADSKGAMADLQAGVGRSIKNNETSGYTSEGRQGLVWRNTDGKEVQVSGATKDPVVELVSNGTEGVAFKFTGADKDGNTVVSYTDGIPVTQRGDVRKALIAAKANAIREGDNHKNLIITNMIGSLDGSINYSTMGAAENIQLHSQNSTKMKYNVISGDGRSSAPIEFTGKEVFSTDYVSNTGIPVEVKTIKTSNKGYINVVGNTVVNPSDGGQLYYPTAEAAKAAILDLKQRKELEVEMEVTRLPTGRVLSPEEKAAYYGNQNASVNMLNEDE